MYGNRDISWLGFNYRVLQEAADPSIPLIERFKFLSIFSSNLDEFFRVRYPSLQALSKLKNKTLKEIGPETTEDLADKAQALINEQLSRFGAILTGELLPQLKESGIVLYYNQPVLEAHKDEVHDIFLSKVLAFLQPVFLKGIDNSGFLPENNRLYLISTLRKKHSKEIYNAVVTIPSQHLPRFYKLQPIGEVEYLIFLDDIIRENLGAVFPGFEVTGCYSFKLNRDAELDLADEYEGDLLKKIEKQLAKRDFGPPSRLLYEEGIPRNTLLFLASTLQVEQDELFAGRRYHNLKDLFSLPAEKKELHYPAVASLTPPRLVDRNNIFKAIEKENILLHFPYDSYNTILAFFNQASIDPNVQEVYITLYRVAADSLIANSLISAAKNGKKVTVFIELKARFDEANNISWSKKMEEAGVEIIYSIPEIKVHSKIALVIKREEGQLKSYAIFSTGNFNEGTAKFYTDHTLLTADKDANKELLALFKFLRTRKKPHTKSDLKFKRLLVAPFNLVDQFEQLIEEQIQLQQSGGEGYIRIKLNNLEEPYMVDLLYKASRAGVKIDLIVRSICVLIPGVLGMSESIEVRRIVDRYLEHTRIFAFGKGKDAKVYIGSSDWMTRNLKRRIEVCIAITDDKCRGELLDYFDLQWKDSDKAVVLRSDMTHKRLPLAAATNRINAQQSIYEYLKQRS